jgi:ELWxxDGT repeat protein
MVLNNKVYFAAATTNSYPVNDQLYESDGTTGGTTLLKTINPTGGAYISRMYVYEGKIYFSATDGVNQNQLWISDGTSAGTYMLKRLNPTGESVPTYFYGYNGKVYFNADDGVNGMQLWTSDGTMEGTVEITTINPTGAIGMNPVLFTAYNSKVFFSGYDIDGFSQLWSTDGTTAGTVKIKADYTPRTYSGFVTGPLAVYNNKLYLGGWDSLSATSQLWVSDGTTAGTTKVTNFSKGFNPNRLYAFQDKLIMTGLDSTTNGEEIFATDGTEAGTVRPVPPSMAELAPFYPWTAWVPFNNGLYFTACYTFWSDYQLCRYTQNPSAIEQRTTGALSVYPNPTHGPINVVLPQTTVNADIELYNSTGTLLCKRTAPNTINKMDLSNQPAGIYIIKVISDNQSVATQKIIKE